MKSKEYNFDQERAILIGMIVSKKVLQKLGPIYKKGMFRNKSSNLIAHWCLKYFRRYKKAPKKNIETLFKSWSRTAQNETTIDLLSSFLDSLSGEYKKYAKQVNSDLIYDEAGKLFEEINLERLSEDITNAIAQGDVQKARDRVTTNKKIEAGIGSIIEPFRDEDFWRRSIERKFDPLITFRQGSGFDKFFRNYLERSAFVSLVGPEKRGKSLWLLDLAFRGVRQNNKVLYFETGDNTEEDLGQRILMHQLKRPIETSIIDYPIRIRKRDNKKCSFKCEQMKKKGINFGAAKKSFNKFEKGKTNTRFKISCHAADTLSIDIIEETIERLRQDNEWIPDIIVIDYADILDMSMYGGGEDSIRERTNKTWKQLRRISQEHHCLVLTATQSDAQSYDAHIITKKHFAESKTKNAHVTGMIGLNQSDKEDKNGQSEKSRNIMRLNWVLLRKGKNTVSNCCFVATCPDIAKMSILSDF